ncbi:MFS transporter [Thiotrichales bacterium 19S3-7]|nr:MFS transporter [Thiotrichales bacterium 19S3-7]MCF6801382.1 MFS transporter [Thiotrichales bacterium 19S3-11]
MDNQQDKINIKHLIIFGIPGFLITFDLIAVGMLLENFSVFFNTPVDIIQLVFSVYAFTMAIFFIPMGILCDRISPKYILLTGITLFGLTSLGIALTTSLLVMVLLRAVMGLSVCFKFVSSLALINSLYDGRAKVKILAYWTSLAALGAVISPVISAFIVKYISWQFIFIVNIPMSVLIGYLVLKYLEKSEQKTKLTFSFITMIRFLLFIIWMGLFILLLILMARFWSFRFYHILAIIFVGLTVIELFDVTKHRLKIKRYIPFSLFTGCFLSGYNYLVMSTWLVSASIWLGVVTNHNLPLIGLSIMSFTTMIVLAPIIVAIWLKHKSAEGVAFVGICFNILGYVLFGVFSLYSLPFYIYCISFSLLGFGCGLISPFANVLALRSVPVQQSGKASGILASYRWLWAALGSAIASIIWVHSHHSLYWLVIIVIAYSAVTSVILFISAIFHRKQNH